MRIGRRLMESITVAALVPATAFVTAGGAAASEPVAGCPTPYFLQDASAYPATQQVDDNGNQDGWVCVQILRTPDPAHAHFVIIDNRVGD